MQRIFPADRFDELLNSFYHAKTVSFCINTLKTNKAQILSKLAQAHICVCKVFGFPDTFLKETEEKTNLTNCSMFLSGEIYIQNLSSMPSPLIINPDPSDRVLDISAAPGGKTTLLAAMMNNQGLISAAEINKSRFYEFLANLKLQGADIV